MTKIKFTGATAIASNHEALTVGAVGLVVRFEFNSAWDGLNKIAVFHCGGVTKDVLGSSFPANICPIPWECLQEEGETLYCGVYGTDSNGKIIIPSKMARLGTVHPAADPTGDESLDPTLPVWQQALNMAQDAMSLLAGKVNRSGDTMQGDLNMGAHTLRLGSTTGMTEDNLNTIRLVADREEEGVTLRNIDTPYEDSDAVNKKYVDDKVTVLQPKSITDTGGYFTTDTVEGALQEIGAGLALKADKSEIPTALPNPHKLTINGTSYDGTEDVQMTIQGGGGESVLYVNVTQSGSAITGDKTYDEILAAITAGKCVIAKLANLSFCLDSVANDRITFQRLDIVVDDGEGRKSIQKMLIYVYNDGVWTADIEFVAVDTAMSDTSEMPVQNKVVKAYIDGLAGDISGKQDKSTLEADVAAKGFTKNTGTYSKPTGGIPKADLATAVQTSLDKADSALQSVPSTYRTAAAQDVIDSGKVDKVDGKGLSSNDYTAAAKAKVDAIPANPKYTDTVYDDTALKERVATIEGKESAWDAKSDFSGNYNDLTNKPTIPAPVTEQTVSGWGFTKNTGTYSKPAGGIPKADLAAAVQTSLGKADSALQSVPSTYRTAAAQDTIDNGKVDKVTGKGLSTNDYTAADKAKVDSIPTIPEYVRTEAETVARIVNQHQSSNSIVFPFLSDAHCGYYTDTGNAATTLAGQLLNQIGKRTPYDFIVHGGDYSTGAWNTTKLNSFEQIEDYTELVSEANKGVLSLWCAGNHDDAPYQATAGRVTQKELFGLVGRKNRMSGAVCPNGCNYGYLDLENRKLRVIYLDTDDKRNWGTVSVGNGATAPAYLNAQNVGGAQLQWLANTGLDFTGKANPAEWDIVVVSHAALNISGTITDAVSGAVYAHNTENAAKIINAYRTGKSGSITHNGVTVNYNFTTVESKATVICAVHGHNHKFGSETLTGGILSIGCPNVMNGRERASDDGNTYTKTAGTANGTSFCILTIDRENCVIYADCVGVGYDREFTYTTEVITYTNQIPISTDASGAVYNGVGYKANTYLSGGNDGTRNGIYATGFIPCKLGDTLYCKNVGMQTGQDSHRLSFYDSSKTHLAIIKTTSTAYPGWNYGEDGNISSIGIRASGNNQNTAFVRFCCGHIGDDSIVTVNEPIG